MSDYDVDRRQTLTYKVDPRTGRIKKYILAVYMYSNEAARANKDFYDDLKLKKIIWSPWFMQK